MSRFMFAVWPIPGHYFPNLTVARALEARGHQVAFVTGRRAQPAIAEQGFECFAFSRVDEAAFDRIFFSAQPEPRWWQPRLAVQRRRSYAWMAGLLDGQAADVEAALDRWQADVLVCDPTLWGPILILPERRRVRLAVFAYIPFCPVPGPDVPPLGFGLPQPRTLPQRCLVSAAGIAFRLGTGPFRDAANRLRRAHGLAPIRGSVSAYAASMPLYLVAGVPELDFDRRDLPPSVRYVGPCLWQRPRAGDPPAWLHERRRDQPWVYVSEGTIHTQEPRVSRAAVQGLAGLPMQVIVSTGEPVAAADAGLGPIAPNVQLEYWVNLHHAELLPQTAVVVTTGGGGTVVAALQEGIPLVIVPTEWDKPDIAARVAASGAGVQLSLSRCTPRRLRDAVERVLLDPSYKTNARRLAGVLARQRGPDHAADLLVDLAVRGPASPRAAARPDALVAY
jgi:UDP:flavonoid glycosyltransferase YjiC (YdhE family)